MEFNSRPEIGRSRAHRAEIMRETERENVKSGVEAGVWKRRDQLKRTVHASNSSDYKMT